MNHVVAIITAKPGMRETILEAFRANIPAAPHMAAYAGKVKDMIASRVIHVLSPAP